MRRRAFTLVEITIVCAILAMMAALVMPNLVAMKANRERKETYNAILRLAQKGRESAIQEGKTYALVLTDSGNTVALQRDQDQQTTTADPRQIPKDDTTAEREEVARVSLPNGVTLGEMSLDGKQSSASDFTLHFYADGKSEGGGFELVDQGSKRTLMVTNRGLASLQDGDLPQTGDTSWEAGQYEQRTTG